MGAPDNLVTNRDKVLFTSFFPTDKIILPVLSGGFTMAASPGSFADTWASFSITGNLTGKVLLQMIWSNDGGVTWQDGDTRVNNYSGGNIQYYYLVTCFASATDVFIGYNNLGVAAQAPARNILYKVFIFSLT